MLKQWLKVLGLLPTSVGINHYVKIKYLIIIKIFTTEATEHVIEVFTEELFRVLDLFTKL